MAASPMFDPQHAALLAMDCQAAIVAMYAKPADAFLERAAAVVGGARRAGMPVVHVRVGFRPGMPEVNERNKLFGALKTSPERQKLFAGAGGEIAPELGPEGDDIVVTKHRVGAFTGTDLEMILRAKGVETLVMIGIATSGVVLSTLVHASDLDYNVIVVGDCCADTDEELHNALLTRYFPRRGTVVSSEELLRSIETV